MPSIVAGEDDLVLIGDRHIHGPVTVEVAGDRAGNEVGDVEYKFHLLIGLGEISGAVADQQGNGSVLVHDEEIGIPVGSATILVEWRREVADDDRDRGEHLS